MELKTKIIALSACLGLFSSAAFAAITGTSSVQATFVTTIEAGTCSAQVQNAAGAPATEIGFGDVFKSDLSNKTRAEVFKIVFSSCAGVKSADVQATPGAGSSCSAAGSTNFGANNATAFEIWQGKTPSGTQLNCTTPQTKNVAMTSGAGTYDLTSRIVVADGKTINNVTTGAVTSPVTFLITYQ
ncbi:fimbrial protein [Enterobacter sp. RHBSTW-00994]|uniref:fimbrial protein n=1 Tax=Enterobacter sp. RHBSTW-00994 TaxID=2742676 RepID=UPI0015E8F930|nr:fimbrial protein [Enterobacter sp. RHBSTW-00994]QLR41876.1 fimbrial protein [Enterobacter sp. RHBSTW-00994]